MTSGPRFDAPRARKPSATDARGVRRWLIAASMAFADAPCGRRRLEVPRHARAAPTYDVRRGAGITAPRVLEAVDDATRL